MKPQSAQRSRSFPSSPSKLGSLGLFFQEVAQCGELVRSPSYGWKANYIRLSRNGCIALSQQSRRFYEPRKQFLQMRLILIILNQLKLLFKLPRVHRLPSLARALGVYPHSQLSPSFEGFFFSGGLKTIAVSFSPKAPIFVCRHTLVVFMIT